MIRISGFDNFENYKKEFDLVKNDSLLDLTGRIFNCREAMRATVMKYGKSENNENGVVELCFKLGTTPHVG